MSKLGMLRAQREAAFKPAVSTGGAKTVPNGATEREFDRQQQAARFTRHKTGRPRIGARHETLAATRPWKAAGMSRRTWFRRQAERVFRRPADRDEASNG